MPRGFARFLWTMLGVLLLAGGVGLWLLRAAPEPLPVLAELPHFDLVDQEGDAFGLQRLSGQVWVANFIFTSCAAVCPRLTALMHDVQTEVADEEDIRLVSVSVDPVRDTPEQLRRYGTQFGADFGRWSFLTGSIEDIEATVQRGFLMTMQKGEPDETGFFDIVHGERFVLVDRRGRIRGYFDADENGIRQLVRAARRLVEEPREEASAAVSQSR